MAATPCRPFPSSSGDHHREPFPAAADPVTEVGEGATIGHLCVVLPRSVRYRVGDADGTAAG